MHSRQPWVSPQHKEAPGVTAAMWIAASFADLTNVLAYYS
jgi:hypothetical protein